jgi:hypothetical protein
VIQTCGGCVSPVFSLRNQRQRPLKREARSVCAASESGTSRSAFKRLLSEANRNNTPKLIEVPRFPNQLDLGRARESGPRSKPISREMDNPFVRRPQPLSREMFDRLTSHMDSMPFPPPLPTPYEILGIDHKCPTCKYYSGSMHLRCTPNPAGDALQCPHFEVK